MENTVERCANCDCVSVPVEPAHGDRLEWPRTAEERWQMAQGLAAGLAASLVMLAGVGAWLLGALSDGHSEAMYPWMWAAPAGSAGTAACLIVWFRSRRSAPALARGLKLGLAGPSALCLCLGIIMVTGIVGWLLAPASLFLLLIALRRRGGAAPVSIPARPCPRCGHKMDELPAPAIPRPAGGAASGSVLVTGSYGGDLVVGGLIGLTVSAVGLPLLGGGLLTGIGSAVLWRHRPALARGLAYGLAIVLVVGGGLLLAGRVQ